MMQVAILDRARVTPSDRKISAARPNLADDCAESRKLDGATAGMTSCGTLRAMLARCQPGALRVDRQPEVRESVRPPMPGGVDPTQV